MIFDYLGQNYHCLQSSLTHMLTYTKKGFVGKYLIGRDVRWMSFCAHHRWNPCAPNASTPCPSWVKIICSYRRKDFARTQSIMDINSEMSVENQQSTQRKCSCYQITNYRWLAKCLKRLIHEKRASDDSLDFANHRILKEQQLTYVSRTVKVCE